MKIQTSFASIINLSIVVIFLLPPPITKNINTCSGPDHSLNQNYSRSEQLITQFDVSFNWAAASQSTPSPSILTETHQVKPATRTPKPTATPLKIPPPTDPRNLNLLILLGILIISVVIFGIIINRRQLKKSDYKNNN